MLAITGVLGGLTSEAAVSQRRRLDEQLHNYRAQLANLDAIPAGVHRRGIEHRS